jgi:hypothetical protein
MQMWYRSRASFRAFAAASTLFLVHGDSTGLFVNGKCLKRASLDAWIVFALGA